MTVTREVRMALVQEIDRPPMVVSGSVPALEPGALLVEVEAATLCGTDIHLWHTASASMPYIAGHESCGMVVAGTGEKTDLTGHILEVGDRIIWAYPFCGECYFCTVANQPTLCPNAVRFGRSPVERYPYLLGGCATHQYVPPKSAVVRVPPGVMSDLAASAGCALRTVMHGFERLGSIAPHEDVVIQGCGPVGLYALAVALSRGANRVLVIGAPVERLKIASKWGASEVLDIESTAAPEHRVEWVRERTDGRGADIVIQCAGSLAIPEGFEMVRSGGRYLSIGEGGASRPLELQPRSLSVKMVQMIGVRSGAGRHFLQALLFLEREGDRFRDMITNTYTLGDIASAFANMKAMVDIKAAIIPEQ